MLVYYSTDRDTPITCNMKVLGRQLVAKITISVIFDDNEKVISTSFKIMEVSENTVNIPLLEEEQSNQSDRKLIGLVMRSIAKALHLRYEQIGCFNYEEFCDLFHRNSSSLFFCSEF